ncbi:MAG: pyridoxal phosphate-dependent aminotransferase [Anaerolineae bacterium]
MKIAKAMDRLGTETAFEVLLRARQLEAQGRDIVHLEIGEPDFDTPPNIVEAAIRALRDGQTHYSPSPGIPELRQAVADQVAATRAVEASPDQVVITPGAKPIMFFAILALVEPGDEVIVPDPGFPIYESMVRFVGGVAVSATLSEENGFRIDPAEVREKASERTVMLILNSPHNPTGGVLDRSDLEALAQIVLEQDMWVLSDEIYARTLYGGQHASIMSLPAMQERTILLDGFSKAYAMTGWRLGYGVMPESLAIHMARLMTNSNSCTATFTQWAGVEALRGPQDAVDEMVAAFRRRRAAVVSGLNRIPELSCAEPQGAFYAFPRITETGMDDEEFADHLLQEAGVAVLAGRSFGAGGAGYVRISYATSVARIEEGLRRIEASLPQRVRA